MAKVSGTGSVQPPCRPLSQETVQKWKKICQRNLLHLQSGGRVQPLCHKIAGGDTGECQDPTEGVIQRQRFQNG